MLTWFLKLIGVSDTLAQRVHEAQWFWARPTVFWVGAALLVPIAVFVVMRHRRSLPYVPTPMRGVLTFCRIGVLALLVFVLAGPYLRLSESVTQKPIVAVLLDESASMDLPAGTFETVELEAIAQAAGMTNENSEEENSEEENDESDNGDDAPPSLTAEQRKTLNSLTRAQLAGRVLAHQQTTLLDALGERFDVRTYRFARGMEQSALVNDTSNNDNDNESAPDPAGAPPARADTAIGAALSAAATDAAGREIAGIILLSDGRNTTGPAPDVVVRAGSAASAMGSDAPIFAVPVGSNQDLADISLVDVLAPQQLARGDTATVVATVRSRGFAGRAVKVTLEENNETLDETQIVLREQARQQANLTFNADAAGTRLLNVEIETLGEERVAANNTQGVTVQVDEQQWQVLYLEGYPRWDFRFLDHALRRDAGVDVRFVMEAQLRADLAAREAASGEDDDGDGDGDGDGDDDDGAPSEDAPALWEMARLPEDASAFAEYHAVILGDISPELLPRRLQEQLAKAVQDEGVGLVVQAGPEHMPHDFANGPLADVLPVKLDPTDNTDNDDSNDGPGMRAPVYARFRMEVTATGSIHPSLRLYDSATKNRQVWSQMSPFYWAAATERAAPGATVLANVDTAGPTLPLIAEHFAGRGRVIFVGTDATYRWRRNIGDHLFYRFWGQAVRHVAKAKERERDESWMEVHPPRVEPGESVAVELYAVNVEGQPLTHETVTVQAHQRGSDASPTSVTLKRGDEPGHYRGQWQSADAGEFELQLATGGGDATTAAVRVAPTGRELIDTTLDRDTLGTLADLTGGALVELARLDALGDRLEGKAATVQQVHEAELWDNWLTLALLVGLYCGDVLVRRMTGVV